ncbi:hypothetical protein IKQ26_02535 [bacterium]|nr:hypothetical protein [bacterium]
MEISPKRVFSGETPDIDIKKKKLKEQPKDTASKSGGETVKSPANPSFYSNYMGIHKTSFGKSVSSTKNEKLDYLKSLKTQDGKNIYEEGNENFAKILENDEAFEFFKTLFELKHDNGEKVCSDENIETLTEVSAMFCQEPKEKLELLDIINTEIKADDRLKDFLELFINEKDENGNYHYTFESTVGALFMAYICVPEDMPVSEVKSRYDAIIKADSETKEEKLDMNSLFELLLYNCAVNKDFDVKGNIEEIKKYNKSGLSTLVSASVLGLEKNEKEIFDRLMSYKNDDGQAIFNGEIMLDIARKNKNPEELFTSLDKLREMKNGKGEPLFENYTISRILSAGADVCKRAEALGDIKDEEVKKAVAGLYDIHELLKDDEKLQRVIKMFGQKDSEGHPILGVHFMDKTLRDDKEISERFIKYASELSNSGVRSYQINELIKKLSDEQCEKVIELGKIARDKDGSSAFAFNLPDVYVKDDETFSLAKKFYEKRTEKGDLLVSSFALRKIFDQGKDYAGRYIRGIELLESIGERPSGSNVESLIKEEETLKKAELFKGITGKNGKKQISIYDLEGFIKSDFKQAQRYAELLKMKTPEGDNIPLYTSVQKEIIEGSEKDFKTIIKYTPLLAGMKTKEGNKIFSDSQSLINCAKGGEEVYSRVKELTALTTDKGKALISSYSVPRLALASKEEWEKFKTVTETKNSLSESLFSSDGSIISLIESKNFDKELEKAKELSELRNPENPKERMLSDTGIVETAQKEGNYTEKLKEYAPKLFALKNAYGNSYITPINIHSYILTNDMSAEKLAHYVSKFLNAGHNGINGYSFSQNNVVKALEKGEEYCDEAIKYLKEISDKKTKYNVNYVDLGQFDNLLGQDIDDIKNYRVRLDKFDEFKDYPIESNLCHVAGKLASMQDEKLEEIFKLARYKDLDGEPFFNTNEVLTIAKTNTYNPNINSVKAISEFSDEDKANLQETINKICTIKKSLFEKPELYVNGTFDNPEDAKRQIDYMFSQHKGAMAILASNFDKETINNIMRQRTAHATEILDTLGSFNKEQTALLKRLINSTNQDGKPFMPAQKIQFIKILSAYSQNDFNTKDIEEMLNSGKVDIGKLELDLLKNIIRQTKISEDVLSKIPPEKIYAWNNPHLHLLVNDMSNDEYLRDFFVNSLTHNFDEYILDETNKCGQANKNTKEIFEKEGLNYQAWVKPNEDLAIDFVSRDKNAQAMLQISEQIQEDIEELRKTPAKKFIDKQLSKYIKEDKFTVPSNCQMSKSLLTEFTQNTIKQLSTVWERAQKNAGNENPEISAKAQNTLTILSHLNNSINDIAQTPDVNFSKNLDLTIKMWDRKPENDIFQGNYSTCCIAIGDFNSSAMPHYLTNTAYNFIEIKNNHTGKTIGNALCYLIKDGNGKTAFVIDNIEIDNKSKPSNEVGIEIRNKMAEYASKIAKEVTGRDDTPVYMSSHYNDVETSDLKEEKQHIEFLGDIDTEKIYMDLYNGWINSKSQLSAEANVLKLK